jgi:site-specific recombinase XerD
MTFQVIGTHDAGHARSPFRILAQPMGREVEWVNRFLDREWVRRLAETTLRSYAMDLLHFLRWWASVNHTDAISEGALSAPVLLDYLRFQAGHQPPPAAATINRRVGVVERALRNEFPDTAPPFLPGFHHWYWRRSPLCFGRAHLALSRMRVKEPKRIVMPLSVDEVARFWSSFRTSRDLAIVGLMLLQGLRLNEVIALNCEDLLLAEGQMRVRGKGNKTRCLPLASDTALLLDHYLRLERPKDCGQPLFVSLKGPARGVRMTPAGMRSLFRYHRRLSQIALAHPHRFRHTFASDMVRAGIGLPALMQLMGHAHISTTMIYVQISPRDVFEQYARAVAQHIRPTLPIPL